MPATQCADCGAPLEATSRFCGACGASATEAPAISRGSWTRRPGEIAARIGSEQLAKVGRDGFEVPHGTKALLLVGGELAAELPAGRHPEARLKDLLGTSPRDASLIAYDAADIAFDLSVRDVFTTDPVRLDIDCRVVVRIDDPRLFAVNELKSREVYRDGDLRGLIYEELHNSFQEHLRTRAAADLSSDLDAKREFEAAIGRHLAETLRRDGLDLIQLRTLRYRHQRLDAQKGMQEEILLAAAEAEIGLEGRQRRFEALSRDEQQAIIESSAEAERVVERNRVRARLREALGADRMDDLRSGDALAAFKLEMDKAELLREDERESLRSTLEEKRSDADQARAHLLAKLEREQAVELERLTTLGGVDTEIERQRRLREAEIDIRRSQDTYDREREDAETRQDQEHAAGALDLVRKMKETRREEADADTDRVLRTERERAAIETERLAALSNASVEALIATSDEEQARILADLKRTETLATLSKDQILAMAAERSPEVAKAFEEQFRSLGTERTTELYERLLSDRDAGIEALRATQSEAMAAMRDVGVAGAGKAPAAGVAGGASATDENKVLICARCRTEVPVGQKHCSNCGTEMY